MSEFHEDKTMMDADDDPANPPKNPAEFQDAKTFMDFGEEGEKSDDAPDAPSVPSGFQDSATLMDAGGAEPTSDSDDFQQEKTFMDFGDDGVPSLTEEAPSEPLEGDPDAPGPSFQAEVTFMDFGEDPPDDSGLTPGSIEMQTHPTATNVAPMSIEEARSGPGHTQAVDVPADDSPTVNLSPTARAEDFEATKRIPPGTATGLVAAAEAAGEFRLAAPSFDGEPGGEPVEVGESWPFAGGDDVVTHFGPRDGDAYSSGEESSLLDQVCTAVEEGGWPAGLTTLGEVCAKTELEPDRAAKALRELAEACRLIFVEVPGGEPAGHYAVARPNGA